MKKLAMTAFAVSAFLLFVSGCGKITEAEGSNASSVVFIRTSDFVVEATIDGIQDGRSICSINSSLFFVCSSSGRLYRIDSAAMAIDTSYLIDSGSGSAAFDMTVPPPGSSIYVLGSNSGIIQVNIASNSVTDIFSAGPSPVAICSSPNAQDPYIYLVDSGDNMVREVRTSDHTVIRDASLLLTPSCVAIDSEGDHLLVGSEIDEALCLASLFLPVIWIGEMHGSGAGAVNDAIALSSQNSSWYEASCPMWSSSQGMAVRIDTLATPVSSNTVEGHPVALAATQNGHYLYVLSNTGDGTCCVTVIDELFGGVVTEIALDGHPRDMVLHRNGEYAIVLISSQ